MLCVSFLLLSTFMYAQGQRVFVREISVEGNDSIDAQTILKAAGLVEARSYGFEEIEKAVEKVAILYHKQGYSAAKIRSAFFDLKGTLFIHVDEGRIASIRVLNNNVYVIYTLKRHLGIEEGEVFNEIFFNQALEALKGRLKVSRFSYVIEASEEDNTQLVIYIRAQTYSTRRFSYTLDARWFKLIPGIGYEKDGFWGLDHELKLYTTLELEVWDIRSGVSGLEYYFPSFLGLKYRPWVMLQRNARKMERDLINVQYREENITLGLYMERRFTEESRLRLGFLRNFFSINEFGSIDEGLPVLVNGFETDRLYYSALQAGYRYYDPEDRYRKDKAFQVEAAVDLIFPDLELPFLRLSADVRKTFEFGFNDLYFRYAHWFLLGPSPFYFDIDAARYGLRGHDTDVHFTRNFFILNTEYRISLYKDILSLLILLDMAVYRPVHYHEDGALHRHDYEFHAAFGEGLAFVWAEFSLRLFYAFPVTERLRDGRVHLLLRKVF
jgi:hypothetical protein